MVDVGMAEHHGVDRGRVEREGLAVAFFIFGAALYQTAIDQDAAIAALDEMAGAGDFAGGAPKLYFHGFNVVQYKGIGMTLS